MTRVIVDTGPIVGMRESKRPGRRMTFEEYVDFEERSSIKPENVVGEVYAMSGATMRHAPPSRWLLLRAFAPQHGRGGVPQRHRSRVLPGCHRRRREGWG